MNRDPDLTRKLYTIEQIASSYVSSHVSLWNMPCDEELAYALQLNAHKPEKLHELKEAYRRISIARSYVVLPQVEG